MVAVSARLLLVASVALSVSAAVLPRAAPGTQFITGPCTKDADCETSCCGFNTGKCAGALVAQSRDGGCGRGEATPNNKAAMALLGDKAPKPVAATKATDAKPAAPTGTQFVTGPCSKDSECETACCGFNSGKCAGAIIAQSRDGGCGRGDKTPNNNAAVALLGDKAPRFDDVKPAAGAKAPAVPTKVDDAKPAVPKGTQFVTGPCSKDSECETGCCGFNSGKCAGALIAQSRDGGCGRGDKTPNNNAAVALLGDKAPRAPGVPAPATKAAAEAQVTATKASSAPVVTGTQFVTGPCSKDSECETACCGFNSGKCAGALIAQSRDGGCGRGDKTPNNNAAVALLGDKAPRFDDVKPAVPAKAAAGAEAPAAPTKATGAKVAVPKGTQFVTGPCSKDSECETGCCGFNSGKCAGALIAQSRDGGCGRGDKTPNNNAAVALLGDKAPRFDDVKSATPTEAVATSPVKATQANPAVPTGTQFITGPCSKDAECDSGCCGFNSGKCAGGIVAQSRDGGCGRGDKTPNNNAAKRILGDKAPRAPGVPRSLARML